jgi:sialic acid synthase SpsE
MKQLVGNIREAEKAVGRAQYGPGKREAENLVFRRSLFAVEDIKKGEKFTRKNIRCIRPGYGMNPKLLSSILGKKAKTNIKRGTPLKQIFIDK